MFDFVKKALELFPYSQELRRDFHIHPELGFQEIRTAGIVAKELNELGLEVATGVGKTGVVGILEGKGPGPVVLLRFDMDALPITEETGAVYASQNPGVMHACGHDGHTAIGLTVAKMLNEVREEFKGSVKFVFQPAEEGLGGARSMVADGVLETPKPDFSLACHIWNDQPYGWVGVTPGPAMAGAHTFRITVKGRGGHGALPNNTIDPIVAAAQIVMALQTIVSRNVPPLEAAVISVTTIHGGDAFNVIPQQVVMEGTIRTFKPEVKEIVMRRFTEVVEGIGRSLMCEASVEIRNITPAVINDEALSIKVGEVAKRIIPEADLVTDSRTMGSEDAAYFMDDIPGCYFFVGSANSASGLDAGHHHPKFDFDERVLSRAAALMAASAIEVLNE